MGWLAFDCWFDIYLRFYAVNKSSPCARTQGLGSNDLFVIAGCPEPLQLNRLERVARIELAYCAWEAHVLPLNYARIDDVRRCIKLYHGEMSLRGVMHVTTKQSRNDIARLTLRGLLIPFQQHVC